MMSDDMTLVREFALNQSEPAFTALVERHIGLVHSAALRQAGDAHLAEEITQAVFIILARKAASFGAKTILSAWLYRATRYAAADALKAKRRRQVREQEAYMQSTLNPPDAEAWVQFAPLLDDALAELGETDRTALVLRFFENKTAREIAGALRMEEAAAQKRVARALEKLRARFVKRGVTLTTAIIAGAVVANSVQAAPAGLTVKVSVVAAKGAVVSTSITTLVKATMNAITWMKVKFALGLGALIVVGIATPIVVDAVRLARAPAATLEIHGIITSTTIGMETGRSATRTNWFIATVFKNNYRIRMGAVDNPSIAYFEAGSLAAGTYLLIMLDTNLNLMVTNAYFVSNGVARLEKLKAPAKAENDAELNLNPGSFFTEASGEGMQAVWLACASHIQFKERASPGSLRLPPTTFSGDVFAEQGGMANTSYRLNQTAPYLLESMTQWEDVNDYQKVGLTPSFDGLYTNVEYEVSNWTNAAGLLIPQHFRVTQYIPDIPVTHWTGRIVYEGTVNEVLTNLEANTGLVVPARTRVIEKRFGSSPLAPDGFVYTTTNGVLLTKKQLLMQSKKFR